MKWLLGSGYSPVVHHAQACHHQVLGGGRPGPLALTPESRSGRDAAHRPKKIGGGQEPPWAEAKKVAGSSSSR
jgi:hypothetical protein